MQEEEKRREDGGGGGGGGGREGGGGEGGGFLTATSSRNRPPSTRSPSVTVFPAISHCGVKLTISPPAADNDDDDKVSEARRRSFQQLLTPPVSLYLNPRLKPPQHYPFLIPVLYLLLDDSQKCSEVFEASNFAFERISHEAIHLYENDLLIQTFHPPIEDNNNDDDDNDNDNNNNNNIDKLTNILIIKLIVTISHQSPINMTKQRQ
ncbi:hypothetical protein M0802_007066 [Mischocyttarus mexicanus]|nr:hypothetical protein M0802_007066 [Mischocyttarus mexicanus]